MSRSVLRCFFDKPQNSPYLIKKKKKNTRVEPSQQNVTAKEEQTVQADQGLCYSQRGQSKDDAWAKFCIF